MPLLHPGDTFPRLTLSIPGAQAIQVPRWFADEFGNRACAIVFSGMAQDAIEGSKYLKAHGGAVWIQDPDTCTISTMVESVRSTGAVDFTGSPQQLAAKMIADHGAA